MYIIGTSVKCITWQIFNEVVENQDLFRKKDDCQKDIETKKTFFFSLKDFIVIKYICKMYELYNYLQLNNLESQDVYRNKDEFRFSFR